MRCRPALCLVVGMAVTYGCSRQPTTNCEPNERYSTARSVQPVQIPDDLSPPNEADALRLPPDPAGEASPTVGGCLESPPSFSGDSRPARRDAESRDELQVPVETLDESAQPSTDEDRVIAN
jgi:hypothetical protein